MLTDVPELVRNVVERCGVSGTFPDQRFTQEAIVVRGYLLSPLLCLRLLFRCRYKFVEAAFEPVAGIKGCLPRVVDQVARLQVRVNKLARAKPVRHEGKHEGEYTDGQHDAYQDEHAAFPLSSIALNLRGECGTLRKDLVQNLGEVHGARRRLCNGAVRWVGWGRHLWFPSFRKRLGRTDERELWPGDRGRPKFQRWLMRFVFHAIPSYTKSGLSVLCKLFKKKSNPSSGMVYKKGLACYSFSIFPEEDGEL